MEYQILVCELEVGETVLQNSFFIFGILYTHIVVCSVRAGNLLNFQQFYDSQLRIEFAGMTSSLAHLFADFVQISCKTVKHFVYFGSVCVYAQFCIVFPGPRPKKCSLSETYVYS